MTGTAMLLTHVGTVAITATTTPFIAKDRFVKNTDKNALAKISYLGDNFTAWFLGKTEDPFPGSILHYAKLFGFYVDDEIIRRLGGEEQAETKLTELFSLMEKQPNGESGALLTRESNLFYIKDSNGLLRVVLVNYGCSNYWNVNADPVASPNSPIEWGNGYRVFSHVRSPSYDILRDPEDV